MVSPTPNHLHFVLLRVLKSGFSASWWSQKFWGRAVCTFPGFWGLRTKGRSGLLWSSWMWLIQTHLPGWGGWISWAWPRAFNSLSGGLGRRISQISARHRLNENYMCHCEKARATSQISSLRQAIFTEPWPSYFESAVQAFDPCIQYFD